MNGNAGVGLIFGAVVGEDVPLPVHHRKADGIAVSQHGVLRDLVDEGAVDKAGIKVAAGVFQRALGPELGLLAPDGDGKLLFRPNVPAVCRDRPAAVSVLHPQAQRHGLFLGVGEVLNDGPQLDLLPRHVRREFGFVATAQKAALPICLILPIAGGICIFIIFGVLGGVSIVAGVPLHLGNRHIEGGRVGDQLAHALGALKGAHIAELVFCVNSHEAIKAGIVHIRIVSGRAGIGLTEAQHMLPLYQRGVRRVRHIQRGEVGLLPHGGRADRILIAQMKQSVSQLVAQDKPGVVMFCGRQNIVDTAFFYIIVGAAEILSAVRQHNKLVDVLINVIILSVLIGLRHGRVGNVRVMDLFQEGRAYDALQNVVSPVSEVDGDAAFFIRPEKRVAAKALFRCRAERIDIEPVRHAAVRLRVQRCLPQLLNIMDEIRLLAFGVALGAEQDHHVLRVAAWLLDHIHRNGGVGVFTVGRVALAHLHLKIRLGVHVPVPVAGVPLSGRKGGVRGLVRRGANIGVGLRAAAVCHGIIRRVQIERRTDAVVADIGRGAQDAPLRGHIAHIVVAVRHRRPQPVVPLGAAPVPPDVVAAEVFIDGMELLHVQQEHLVGDVFVMCALIALCHRADVGVVGEVGPRRVDVARGVLRVGDDGALRHRFDGGGLVRLKAVEEARLVGIRAIAVVVHDIAVLGRVAAEPFHLSGLGVGIEPRAHIAVPPVVGAVFAPVAAAPVRAAVGILAGPRVIGHIVAQHPV